MNTCQANVSAIQVAKAFVARFHVEAASQCAQYHGFTHVARVVSYNPSAPFTVCEGGIPFASEDEAHDYCRSMIKIAVDTIFKLKEDDRKQVADDMLSEADGVCTVRVNYDALLVKNHPQLVALWTPLPEVSVNVAKLVEYYTSEFSDYAINHAAVMTWFGCMLDSTRTYAQSVRDYNKVMRVQTQERVKKEKAQAKAKAVKAEAKAKARPKAKAKAVKTLPTIPE